MNWDDTCFCGSSVISVVQAEPTELSDLAISARSLIWKGGGGVNTIHKETFWPAQMYWKVTSWVQKTAWSEANTRLTFRSDQIE